MLWRFGDKGILLAKIDIETNETSLNADERFRDRLKLDQTGFLTIKNTKTTDSGLYELQIRGSESLWRFLVSVRAVPDPGLSSGVIAGIVAGVLISVLAAAVALIYYNHRISKLKRQMGKEKEETVTEGESVTLQTDTTEIQESITIKWCYETEDNLIAEIKRGTRNTWEGADGRFWSKLSLNERTGDLTISNVRTIHSGLYKLKISSSSRRTKYKRFILTVNVRTVSVEEGGSVTLQTNAKIQRDYLILWTFGAENLFIVKKDSETTRISERFRGRLRLGKRTGSLTITNITKTDSGHFKLQIINGEKTTFRRFNVTVTGNRVGDLVTVVMPLLNGDDLDGVNEQEETWSL
ncbi:uncharacterized protein LOC127519760 isoform X1 [Ctenopharyngodon idella]|uniref:uncharacterized protein LOC127519760 isoform X1 n=1 Tax=Ctenopharyngodon idella TaxID=7959 RepID=UPI0022326222|nr:uncharacterized protein LOC127519760 isoform X1 [Ctenopharyngodon idella]